MDQEVRIEFSNLNTKLDDFILAQAKLYGNIKTEHDVLVQRFDNGETQEQTEIKKKAVRFSLDRLIVSIVVGAFGIFEVLKNFGVI